MQNTRCWTKKELKHAYNIGYGTLLEWLQRIPGLMDKKELKRIRKFSPAQCQKIFSHLGEPGN